MTDTQTMHKSLCELETCVDLLEEATSELRAANEAFGRLQILLPGVAGDGIAIGNGTLALQSLLSFTTTLSQALGKRAESIQLFMTAIKDINE